MPCLFSLVSPEGFAHLWWHARLANSFFLLITDKLQNPVPPQPTGVEGTGSVCAETCKKNDLMLSFLCVQCGSEVLIYNQIHWVASTVLSGFVCLFFFWSNKIPIFKVTIMELS